MRFTTLICALILSVCGTAQEFKDTPISEMEDSLKVRLQRLRDAKSDTEKEIMNVRFKAYLERVIVTKHAFNHPFDSLKTMGTLISPDETFRFFNWNIENDDGTQSFYCYVVKPSRGNKPNTFIELVDRSAGMKGQPVNMSLDNNRWYGALYYKIIPVKKGSRTFYTLLAWDGNNRITTKKFIETMYFSGSRRIKFGYPLIKTSKGTQKRFFLEFTSEQYVSMKHKPEKKSELIIFDHLSPKVPALEGVYSEYVVDGSHDAFRFEGGYWIYISDYYAVNKNIKDGYNDPTKKNNRGDLDLGPER